VHAELPFALGQCARPYLARGIERQRARLSAWIRGRYCWWFGAFGAAVSQGPWQRIAPSALFGLLLALVLLITLCVSGLLGFSRADRIAIGFCGSKKAWPPACQWPGCCLPPTRWARCCCR